MIKNLTQPRAITQAQLDADHEPGRERLARLIGRLIAQEWLRHQTDDEGRTRDHKEVG